MGKLWEFIKGTRIASRVLFILWLFFCIFGNFANESKALEVVDFTIVYLFPALVNELSKNPIWQKSDISFFKFMRGTKTISRILFQLWMFASLLTANSVPSNFLHTFPIMAIPFLIPAIVVECKMNPCLNKKTWAFWRGLSLWIKCLLLVWLIVIVLGSILFFEIWLTIFEGGESSFWQTVLFVILTCYVFVNVLLLVTQIIGLFGAAIGLIIQLIKKKIDAISSACYNIKRKAQSKKGKKADENSTYQEPCDTKDGNLQCGMESKVDFDGKDYYFAGRCEDKNSKEEEEHRRKEEEERRRKEEEERRKQEDYERFIHERDATSQKKQQRRQRYQQQYSVDLCRVDSADFMEGHSFEHFCADLLRDNGYIHVSVTPGSGDQGADVIAEKDGVRYAIQCKNYASPLSNTPIQEVNAGKMMYKCHVGVVMTNSTFTPGAKALADATGVLLWDRTVLQKMMASLL